MFSRIVLPLLLIVFVAGTAVASNYVDAQSGRTVTSSGTSYWRELDVHVDGAVNVQSKTPGNEEWEDFGYDEEDGMWFVEADGLPTLSDLNNETSGPFMLRVQMPGGNADYTFDVNSLVETDFPGVPQAAPIPALVPQDYTYQWTWGGGAADGLGVGLRFETGESYQDDSVDGTMSVADLSWQPDVAMSGAARFNIGYAFVTAWQLSNWTFSEGSTTADVFDFSGGDYRREFIVSEHEVAGFQVVPEPATAVLLACGCAALWHRRRRR